MRESSPSRSYVSSPLLLLALCFFMGAAACSTGRQGGATWPEVDALTESAPADLDREAPATVLRRGSDGFLYIVGGLPEKTRTGARFLARYSGDWPLQDLPRPPLATGHVLQRLGDVARVQLDYSFPETELEGLEVTFEEEAVDEDLGKGMGTVTKLKPSEQADLELSLGEELGVQPGDIYAVLSPVQKPKGPAAVQLSRRLIGVCLVDQVAEESSTCRLWRGSKLYPLPGRVAVGQPVTFLEHTFGQAPRQGRIKIAAVQGDGDGALQARLAEYFRNYLEAISLANAEVEVLDASFDATSDAFHKIDDEVEYDGQPTILVAGSVVERDGEPHLIVNYGGIGPATGPGMVAAPPEGGVDLGPVDELSSGGLRGFAGVVWAGLQVFRGQTSEAMMHLHQVLSDAEIQGPNRWHARDQFAMRWAALGRDDEALHLVLEDEAVARRRDDERAYLNALGTRVRLLDMLEQPAAALAAAELYLDARREEAPSSPFLSALGMYIEMLLAAEKVDEAKGGLADLREYCPDGCGGDLAMLLQGIYWSVPESATELQADLLRVILDLSEGESGPRLAGARIYQGLSALQQDRLEDALIAFLEAERLYSEANYTQGVARAKYFMFLTQHARGEPQKAFELGIEAIELDRELRDFPAAAQTYERLASLYMTLDQSTRPGPYLGAAEDVLVAAVQSQLAMGDYGKASEALFSLASFLFKIGELSDSRGVFQRAVLYAIRSTRFDIAALSHLSLGMIARAQDDPNVFRDEIQRARLMAELSADPEVIRAIERALSPPEAPGDVPSQVL